MKKLFTLLASISLSVAAFSQCVTTNISGDYTQTTDIILSGVINVTGTYTLPAGVTITVSPFTTDSCGSLTINAKKIVIEGTINADYAGYPGGAGGAGGSSVTSVTGHTNALTGCQDKDNPGQITVGGGQAGQPGAGPGGGLAGTNGTVGSGSKQECQNSGDEAGLVGGSGGAGGGAGGSYGGAGASGGNGGNGAATATVNGFSFSPAYSPLGGTGGLGGAASSVYGTANGNDIDLGSGGAGAGGGGRSYYVGEAGLRGGNGGGMVKLVASDTLIVTGTITANGEDGKQGGKGGNGDQSPDCCNDLCSDCGEKTFSAGAGGGAGSGAGSGGGIYLQSGHIAQITGTLTANGGVGGNSGIRGNGVSCSYNVFTCGNQNVTTDNGSDGNSGGSGGGGRIKIFSTDCPSNVVNPTHQEAGGTGAEAGTYAHVTVNCPNFASIENFDPVFTATVFPNPASETVTLQIHAASIGIQQAEVLLLDATGRIISSNQYIIISGQQLQFDVSQLSAGLYSFWIRNDKLNKYYPFIKN